MMETSVATSGQNGMKESRVKTQFADLSKQVPDAEVVVKGKRCFLWSGGRPRRWKPNHQLPFAAETRPHSRISVAASASE